MIPSEEHLRFILIKEIKEGFIEGKKANRDVPALNALSSKPVIEDIISAVEFVFIEQPALAKNVSLYLGHRHTAGKHKHISRHLNIGESAVSQANRRISMKTNN